MPVKPTNPDGLTVQQRRILMDLAAGRGLSEIYEAEHISSSTFNRWLKNPAFKQAFDDLFSQEDLDNLKKQLNVAAGAAIDVYLDAMQNAVRKISVWHNCVKCDAKQQIIIDVEDYKARLHASDAILKITSIWVDRRSDKLEVNHTYQLSSYEMATIMAYRAGKSIPPAEEARLRQLGFIETPALPPATYREIEE